MFDLDTSKIPKGRCLILHIVGALQPKTTIAVAAGEFSNSESFFILLMENSTTVTVSDLSDTDILMKYCHYNKTGIDELLKHWFNSLAALKLVEMED